MKAIILILFMITYLETGQNKIAYLSNQSGNFDIYIIDEKGEDQQQLTYDKG